MGETTTRRQRLIESTVKLKLLSVEVTFEL